LALIALAINFALTFGHVHAVAGEATRDHVVTVLTAAHPANGQGQSNEGDPDYLCPICIALNAIADAIAAVPPVIPLQRTETTVDSAPQPVQFVVELARPAFQSRGPPIS
jgi:hypothetical protein